MNSKPLTQEKDPTKNPKPRVRKIFNIGGKKLRVSVMETTKAAGPLAKKAESLGRNGGLGFRV